MFLKNELITKVQDSLQNAKTKPIAQFSHFGIHTNKISVSFFLHYVLKLKSIYRDSKKFIHRLFRVAWIVLNFFNTIFSPRKLRNYYLRFALKCIFGCKSENDKHHIRTTDKIKISDQQRYTNSLCKSRNNKEHVMPGTRRSLLISGEVRPCCLHRGDHHDHAPDHVQT